MKDTLNLPQTGFPMRADLVNCEPKRIQMWEEDDLYAKIQEKNLSGKPFILHDGPPFTNGDVHIGTALNKILKDIIIRHRSMHGYRTPYIPGWDCHGLPIEHKVSKELKAKNQSLDVLSLRQECATFSKNYIEKQRKQFKRLGILADWEHEYRTMDPKYEEPVLEFFADCVAQGLIYRGKKPVYWSIPCRTALAEAEIEYKQHTSPSIWVKFKLEKTSADKLGLPHDSYVIIWTTTPWTIPSNVAIAVHPNLKYSAIQTNDGCHIVGEELLKNFAEECSISYTVLKNFTGSELEHVNTKHPILDRLSPIVLANYVTTDAGTGCVHTAPGHGLEDYVTGLNYKLEVYSPIGDDGCYIDDGRIPAKLIGVSVLEPPYDKNSSEGCPANKKVIEMLKKANSLVHEKPINHQYPFCWRSKTPVIFRAMSQWFISLDNNELREKLLNAVSSVTWLPGWGENRIRAAIETRPDWCISRQRAWGIPLPVFYSADHEPLIDESVIRMIAKKIGQYGSDFWFSASIEEILDGIKIPESWDPKSMIKSTDTLDVWLDSGNSHRAVLKKNPDLTWPADLYLEGSDQHRGWFQSSLWASVISENGKAPFKTILTHGFVVDENKKKVSKSDNKPQTADDYVNKFGADIVRLWVASEDFRTDITVSDDIFNHIVSSYRTIRNTLKFQIGNLYDFDPKKDMVSQQDMTIIDKWILQKTRRLVAEADTAYIAFDMHKVYQLVNKFCTSELSSVYHDVLKDRLYTYTYNSPERRSSQSAIYVVLNALIAVLAPILTFTCDEALAYLLGNSEVSDQHVQLMNWPKIDEIGPFENEELVIDTLLKFRDKVNEKLEHTRQAKIIGQSLEALVHINCSSADPVAKLLKEYRNILEELFIVSQIDLKFSEQQETTISVEHAKGEKCPRSWKWVPELVDAGRFGRVSPKSLEALKAKFKNFM